MAGEKSEKTGGKKAQILAQAGAMFIALGFDAVSMEALAEAVPVSKPTLYNHFRDKKSLFKAVMEQRCANFLDALDGTLDSGAPRAVLTHLGLRFLDRLLAPDALALHRIILAEAQDFPDLGQLFYENGPKRVQARLAAYLAVQAKAGALTVPDPARSASFFLAAVKGEYHLQRLLGLRKAVSAAERRAGVDYAVDVFLGGHAAVARQKK